MDVVSALRGVVIGRPDGSNGPAETDEPADVPRTALFECPACGTVYVAVEQARCSSCDVAVEPVPAFGTQ